VKKKYNCLFKKKKQKLKEMTKWSKPSVLV